MKFSEVQFVGNRIHYKNEAGVQTSDDFFQLLMIWARNEKGVTFSEELSQIRVAAPEGSGPVRMTFKEALNYLPTEAKHSAIMKAINLLIPEGTYKTVPRKAPAVIRKIGKVHKIRIEQGRPVGELFETILNCTLGDLPIPAPPKRRRRAKRDAA